LAYFIHSSIALIGPSATPSLPLLVAAVSPSSLRIIRHGIPYIPYFYISFEKFSLSKPSLDQGIVAKYSLYALSSLSPDTNLTSKLLNFGASSYFCFFSTCSSFFGSSFLTRLSSGHSLIFISYKKH